MAESDDDINYDEWDVGMALIGDDGYDAGYRIKNMKGETERVAITGYDRKSKEPAVLGRLFHVVNGYMRDGWGSRTPATLVVFEWLLRTGSARRFRQAQIQVAFEAQGLRDGMLPDEAEDLSFYTPAVVKVAPMVSESDPVEYTVDQKTGFKLGANIGFNGASVSPEVAHDESKAGIRRIDYRVQEGHPMFVQRDRGPMDGAQWTLKENSTAESGLPRLVRTAILLERQEGDETGRFAATIKTKASVSVWEDAAEKIRRAVGKVPEDDPVVFDPAPRQGIDHGATVLFGSKDVEGLKCPFDKNNLASVDLDECIVIGKKGTAAVVEKGSKD